ncbi:DUF559 domain-containing protein [Bifidobacterium tissieri]|uniref:DUF559 domain-containing protein n=1 Tax=Bifidobacterium tissieri TaxID=1630162 RepID=UPI001239B26C|nr:DUF559 domain-containing protein [Bifidobacterium tissieri]KAA8831928.1 DUF559 domain-containing protein [Bifidobacterium tissieri]
MGIYQPHSPRLRTDTLHVVVKERRLRPRLVAATAHAWRQPLQTMSFTVGNSTVFHTSPLATWAQLSFFIGIEQLVATGDAILNVGAQFGITGPEQFMEYLGSTDSFRGRRQCLRAAGLIRPNVFSFPESMMRLVLLRGGMPDPIPNYELHIPSTGRKRYLDLAYPQARLDIEYDGNYHLDRQQKHADIMRSEELRKLGWDVLIVTAEDLKTPESRRKFVERVASRLGLSVPDEPPAEYACIRP